MHHFSHNNLSGQCRSPVHHQGLIGVFGGIINLTTATLYGGASVVRRIVEGAVWNDACKCSRPSCETHNCTCQPARHCYCVECVPKTYTSSCR